MSVKDINIKNRTYYFLNDTINIKDFDPYNVRIDKKSYKNILIYYIGYVTINKDLKIYSVNLFYLIFDKVNRYFKEINGNKYLTLVPANKSKKRKKKSQISNLRQKKENEPSKLVLSRKLPKKYQISDSCIILITRESCNSLIRIVPLKTQK